MMNEPTKAITDVIAERARQQHLPEHDDIYEGGELAEAGASYALLSRPSEYQSLSRAIWPWDLSNWKPKSRRQNLVRAAALLIAEIERLDRAGDHG